MNGRGRIAAVVGPLLALLLLLATGSLPRLAADSPAAPSPAVAPPLPAVAPTSPAVAPPSPAVAPSLPAVAPPSPAAALGGEPPVLSAHASADCPLAASRVGRCGTVAGFSGWYGSWDTAGSLGAYCLEHAKSQPRAALAYTHQGSAAGQTAMTADGQQRIGYLLGRYAGTSDQDRAAALAILVHAAQGDTLTTDELHAYSTSLPGAVRDDVLGLWSEAGDLHGPYSASMAVAGSGTGALATLTVRSAAGKPVQGMPVSWAGSSHGDEQQTTDAHGTATLRVGAVDPGATVTAQASVGNLPQPDFAVWVPRDSTVQRVAVPLPAASVSAHGTWTAPAAELPPASVQIVKTTDDPAYVSPAGAVFVLRDRQSVQQGLLVVDASGNSNVVTGLSAAAGPWSVSEEQACAGCDLAPPQSVALVAGRVTAVTVVDHVIPHLLGIRKTTLDGQPLAGATLQLRGASTPGGAFDRDLGSCVSAADGSCDVPGHEQLPPGDYQVTEEQPAPGTGLASPPVQVVQLRQADVTVTFADPRLTTVGFRKTDTATGSSVDHAHESLAGAVFVVSAAAPGGGLSGGGSSGGGLPGGGLSGGGSSGGGLPGGGLLGGGLPGGALPGSSSAAEVGRCTTAPDATCTLPPGVLTEGATYSWVEVTAPPGFALDPTVHTFTATWASTPQVFQAADAGRYASVILTKHEAGSTTPVPGATLDLCASGLPVVLSATWTAPTASACPAASSWVGAAVTDSGGSADFGLLPPGGHYCAVERLAPAGWILNQTPVCGDLGPAGDLGDAPPQALTLDLAEQPVPTPSTAPPASRAPTSPAPGPSSPGPSSPGPSSPAPTPPVLAGSVRSPLARPSHPAAGIAATPAVPVMLPSSPELAFTGASGVVPTLAVGAALLILGITLVAGVALTTRSRRTWGGWTP